MKRRKQVRDSIIYFFFNEKGFIKIGKKKGLDTATLGITGDKKINLND